MESYLSVYTSPKQYKLLLKGREAIASSHEGVYDVINTPGYSRREKFMLSIQVPSNYLLSTNERRDYILLTLMKKDPEQHK